MGHGRSNRSIPHAHLALALLVLGACASHAPGPVVVPLLDDEALAELGFEGPMVALTFRGRTAWFLFDTGAGVHTLAQWFVEAAGMEIDDGLADGLRVVDSTGAPVEFQTVQGEVGRLPDGTAVALELAIVADFPSHFKEGGIGGLINPQLLAGEGQGVLLDLRTAELRIEPFEDAVRRIGAQRVAEDQVEVCRDAEAPIPNQLFAIRITSRDEDGWLQLDTGSRTTELATGSALVRGLELEPGGESMGVADDRVWILTRGEGSMLSTLLEASVRIRDRPRPAPPGAR